jgi:hypothetical protein
MKTQLMILTFIGTALFAQGQNQLAPAVAEGPGVSQGGSDGTPQANTPGPGERGPQGRRFAGPGQPGGHGGPGERFASAGRGPMSGPMSGPMPGPRPSQGCPGLRPENGGPEMAGGPGFGGAPEFSFEHGSDVGQMDDPEDEDMDGDEELAEGPEFGGAPGFDRGPGVFGPRHGGEAFGPMGLPPGAALQAVLGLDDRQAQSLRQLQREKSRKLDEAQFQLRQKQGALMDLLEQEEPDGNALVSTVKSIHALRKQAGEIEKEFQAKTGAVLNEEQKTRLKSLQDRRQAPQAMQEAARFDLVRPMGGGPGGPVPEQ